MLFYLSIKGLIHDIFLSLLVVKQFTNILINRGPFNENTATGLNITVLVFLQYVISSLMRQQVWFPKKFWQKSVV